MDAAGDDNRRRAVLLVGALVAALAIAVGVLILSDDDSADLPVVAATTTEQGQASTTSTTSTSEVDASQAVFPDATTSRRFDDPKAAARAFAVELLGFSDPVIGELRRGDSRSGEVEVRGFAQGAPTTVTVRQLEDNTWFVLGASVESIRLDAPRAGATISSPLSLTGAAWAFEGHVAVRLFADGVAEPVAETFVIGRGDQMGDFAGEVTFDVPAGVKHGVLVLFEPSAKDGSTIAATVIRVHF